VMSREGKHTNERLKWDRKKSVQLPRGGCFESLSIVREHEMRVIVVR
jgi:hypothetical protein